MLKRDDMLDLVVSALKVLEGRGSVVSVAKQIWDSNEAELRRAGNIFYSWQYDMRWAAHKLRKRGTLKSTSESPAGIWELR